MPCPFNCLGHFPLVFGGSTGDPAWQNLTLFVDEFEQEVSIFVINVFNPAFLETAIFFLFGINRDRGQIFYFTCLLCAMFIDFLVVNYSFTSLAFSVFDLVAFFLVVGNSMFVESNGQEAKDPLITFEGHFPILDRSRVRP